MVECRDVRRKQDCIRADRSAFAVPYYVFDRVDFAAFQPCGSAVRVWRGLDHGVVPRRSHRYQLPAWQEADSYVEGAVSPALQWR